LPKALLSTFRRMIWRVRTDRDFNKLPTDFKIKMVQFIDAETDKPQLS
jgi:hypothetical protein